MAEIKNNNINGEIPNDLISPEEVQNGNANGDNGIVYFAQTNFRNERRSFGIKQDDRSKHVYIIGKTGMGKSTVLENMAIQDIQKGEGVGIVDPHGQFAEKILSFIPEKRVKEVVYFCPHDIEDNCSCRKPKPGMLLKAAKDLNIDLAKSYIIGDGSGDILAGQSAGCKTIFLGSSELAKEWRIKPDFITENFSRILEYLES